MKHGWVAHFLFYFPTRPCWKLRWKKKKDENYLLIFHYMNPNMNTGKKRSLKIDSHLLSRLFYKAFKTLHGRL